MPLPKLGGSPRLRTDVRPKPTESIQQAGMVGRALTNVSVQATEFAQTLVSKRQAAKKNEFISKQMIDLYQHSSNLEAEAKKRFSDDHEGYSDFIRTGMEKAINDMGKNAPFSEAQEAFAVKANSLMASEVSKATDVENTARAKFYEKSAIKIGDDAAYSFYTKPDIVKGEQAAKFISNQLQENESILFNQDQIDVLKKATSEKIAHGNMRGLMEMGEFSKAAKLVQDNYLNAFDTPEKSKEALSEIRSKQQQVFSDRLRLEAYNDKITEEQQKEREDQAVMSITQQVTSGNIHGARQALEEAHSQGIISSKAFRVTLNQTLEPAEKDQAETLKFSYMNAITEPGADLELYRKNLQQDIMTGIMPADVGEPVLRQIRTLQKQANTSPVRGIRLRLGESAIKDQFKTDPFMHSPKQIKEMKQQKFEALQEWTNLIENPEVDPQQAALSAIKKVTAVQSMPKVAMPPKTPKFADPTDYEGNIKKVGLLWKNNKLSKEEALKIREAIIKQRDAANLENVPTPDELRKQ